MIMYVLFVVVMCLFDMILRYVSSFDHQKHQTNMFWSPPRICPQMGVKTWNQSYSFSHLASGFTSIHVYKCSVYMFHHVPPKMDESFGMKALGSPWNWGSRRTWDFNGILMECDGILIHFLWDLPSGFYRKPTGKIHHAFLMGKSTISMAVFNSYVRNLKWSIFFSDDADTSQRGHDLKLSRSIECTLWTATGPLGSLGSLGPWGHYM